MKTRNLLTIVAMIFFIAFSPESMAQSRKEKKEARKAAEQATSPDSKSKTASSPYLKNHSTTTVTKTVDQSENPFALYRQKLCDENWYVFKMQEDGYYLTYFNKADILLSVNSDEDSIVYRELYRLEPAYCNNGRITKLDIINQTLTPSEFNKILTERDYKHFISETIWDDGEEFYYGTTTAMTPAKTLPLYFIKKGSKATRILINNETMMFSLLSDTVYIPTLVGTNVGGNKDGSFNLKTEFIPRNCNSGNNSGTSCYSKANPNSGETWHTVQANETLGDIAEQYQNLYPGIGIWRGKEGDGIYDKILELNLNIDPDNLSVGQKIRVK